jgi:hypothetical protein
MRSLRFSIAKMMGIIVLVALGAAALRNASQAVTAVVSIVTHGVLSLAIVGAVCRTGAQRTWWLGFAMLGWTYLGLPLRSLYSGQLLASRIVLKLVSPLMGVTIGDGMPFAGGAAARSFFWIGHYCLALVAAVAGGLLAGAVFGAAKARSMETASSSYHDSEVSTRWWALPAMIVLSVLVLTTSIAIGCARWDPRISAGSTYLLTWWLIGLTSLGAVFGRGRRREFWLGTTLLGTGFLILVFNRPVFSDPDHPRLFLPTVQLLEALRPRFALIASGFSADTEGVVATAAHIERALAQPVPINFPNGTTLERFLEYAQEATRSPNGGVIPIYVDPIGLQEVEHSMTSTLQGVHLEGVALRNSLRLCLRQLDLTYAVRDGLIMITSQDSEDERAISPNDDPYEIVGHCLLALVAAALGGLAAPFVCDLARGSYRGAST